MPATVLKLAAVHRILVLLDAEGLTRLDLLVVKHVGLHGVIFCDGVHVPFSLLSKIGFLARLCFLLLLDERLDSVLVQVGRITEAARYLK